MNRITPTTAIVLNSRGDLLHFLVAGRLAQHPPGGQQAVDDSQHGGAQRQPKRHFVIHMDLLIDSLKN
jgi:hypothetical protein